MNKNILIVLLVMIIGVLGYLQFRPKNMVVPKEQTKVSNVSGTADLELPKDSAIKNYSGNNF